jgi:DNA-3-methyladenine glycosylase II
LTGETTPMVALASADPVMAKLIKRLGAMTMERRRRGRPKDDAYGVLLRSVIGQQLSTKAAQTIFDRMLAIYDGKMPTPQQILDTDGQELRDIGFSWRKVEYVKDLAQHVLSGELEIDRLDQLSDDEVIAEITAVRGFGVWSAHMFLIFHLERPDVLPTGDLGIRNAIQAEYGLDEPPTPADMEKLGEAWKPHRSLASLYLWESLANNPVD